ncbi:SDR family oxidoreductase [Candidatus Aerophobetes bacterium]|nr:SDR family oxidoreductase [Candidatus Aerophobetes bacterium]
MKELAGKIAVVTGGARGIGKAICNALAKEGASVIICDIDLSTAEKTVEELKNQKFQACAFKVDVSSGKDVKRVFGKIIDEFQKVDILVNNAGVTSLTPFENITEEEWDRVLAINLKSAFLCSQAVMQGMIARRWGKIVNIASLAGKVGGLIVGAHYAVSKAGIICLTKALARRLAPYGINVNAVAPGQIKTKMTDIWSDEDKERFRKEIPLGRFGEPEEVAEAVLFLVSERAKFITGEILDVNGGILMD